MAEVGTDYASAPLGEQFAAAAPTGGKRYGADVIVDLLNQLELPYAALNPGASFRGLHDSLVNYGANKPEMILCQHEEIAVGLAHGYAKATGKPMVAIVHNTVGLLHSCMAVFEAYMDRAPVIILGATGPMNEVKRRPWIDWIHTANVQGTVVRDFVKWDDQPSSVEGFPGTLMRGYRVAMSQPQGPVYLCFDAQLQEDLLDRAIALPRATSARVPTRMAADPGALEQIADMLMAAERPVILAEYVGRQHQSFYDLVRLSESLSVPVVDLRTRLNFPSHHPLNASHTDILEKADLLLYLDVRDAERVTTKLDSATREVRSVVRAEAKRVEIGFADLEISSWSTLYGRLQEMDLSVLGDTSLAIPALADLLEARVQANEGMGRQVAARRDSIAQRHRQAREKLEQAARENWDAIPMTTGRLALEVWDAIKSEDWVLTAGTLSDQASQLWDFDKPYRHPGNSLGTATQIGISLGVALAYKGSGKLVVDLQPDGDLMFDAGALWVAAKHELPFLIVMHNNRAYYNDWEHQIRMARVRGTPMERANIGMDMRGPAPDFARLAQSMGWYAEGPIEDPREVAAALKRAIAEVKSGRPALVDTVTRFR